MMKKTTAIIKKKVCLEFEFMLPPQSI